MFILKAHVDQQQKTENAEMKAPFIERTSSLKPRALLPVIGTLKETEYEANHQEYVTSAQTCETNEQISPVSFNLNDKSTDLNNQDLVGTTNSVELLSTIATLETNNDECQVYTTTIVPFPAMS